MSNPFSRAAIRREFPVERIPAIVDSKGRVNRNALRMVFSGNGCPNAKTEIAVAAIKSGLSAHEAVMLAMLACHMAEVSPETVERMTNAIAREVKETAARKFPNSKWAEERAARLEGRASRWDSNEFFAAVHRGEDVSTPHYPYRAS